MKHLYLVYGLLISFTSYAQKNQTSPFPRDSATRLITYAQVVTIEGATKEQLTGRAKYFFTHAFRDRSLQNIESDWPSGLVSTKGVVILDLQPGNPLAPYVRLLLPVAVWVKEGRYRYAISHLYILSENPIHDEPLEESTQLGNNPRFHKRIDTFIREFIAQLDSCMRNSKLDNF